MSQSTRPGTPTGAASISSNVFVCVRCQKGMIVDSTLEEIDASVFGGADLSNREMNSQSAVLTTLLELASDSSLIEHPLCNECSQLLTFELHKQLAEIEQENDRYTQYYTQLNENEKESEDLDSIDQKIAQVSTERGFGHVGRLFYLFSSLNAHKKSLKKNWRN